MASASRALVSPLPAAASRLLQVVLQHSPAPAPGAARWFATQRTYYLRGKMLHCSDPPTKHPIHLNGRDFYHWLVVMESPPGDPADPDVPRDHIIHSYVETLAQVLGSKDAAKKMMYSVSTRHYFAFGAMLSEEDSCKLRELPRVRWVLPDSYLNAEERDYGGEPFVNGKALPYNPKYHLEWLKNDAYTKRISRLNDQRHNRKMSPANHQSSSSDSESSSSDSDWSIFSGSDLDVKQSSSVKENDSSADSLDQENGENMSENQVSAAKQIRAALLRICYADKVLEARKALAQVTKMDPEKLGLGREELERLQRERARLQAEVKAAEDACRRAETSTAAEAAAEAMPQTDHEEEAPH